MIHIFQLQHKHLLLRLREPGMRNLVKWSHLQDGDSSQVYWSAEKQHEKFWPKRLSSNSVCSRIISCAFGSSSVWDFWEEFLYGNVYLSICLGTQICWISAAWSTLWGCSPKVSGCCCAGGSALAMPVLCHLSNSLTDHNRATGHGNLNCSGNGKKSPENANGKKKIQICTAGLIPAPPRGWASKGKWRSQLPICSSCAAPCKLKRCPEKGKYQRCLLLTCCSHWHLKDRTYHGTFFSH